VTEPAPAARLAGAIARIAQRFLVDVDFNAAAAEALAVLGKATGSCRGYAYRNRTDAEGRTLARSWREWSTRGAAAKREGPPWEEIPLLDPEFRELGEPLARGETRARAVADFGEPLRSKLAATGARSVLCVPIFVGEEWWGFLGLDDCRDERTWSEAEIDTLRAAADITGAAAARHRMERALAESESKFRELFENAGDVFWAIDLEGRFTTVNRAMGELLGCDAEELVGHPWEEIIPEPDQREIVRAAMRKKLVEGRTDTQYEVRLRRRDGSFVAVEVGSRLVLRDGRPAAIHGIGRDVSERRRLEEQLRQAVKMEAVGRLAASIAHEFNHLIAAIRGYGERILGRLRPNDPVRSEVAEIVRAGEQASELTRELLAFGRQQPARPSKVDVNELLHHRLATLRRVVSEDVAVVDLTEARVGKVHADPNLIEQILINLLVNARDAMPEGGRIELSTALSGAEEIRRRGIEHVPHSTYVRLSIRDTGHGIDPGAMARIFEPFFTTRERGRGTGLGLSTVYGIVKQCEGYIFADSHPGQGAVFHVYLPQVEPAGSRRPSGELRLAPASGGAAEPSHEQVLLVEDEDLIRNLAQQILVDRGYRVAVAANASEALDLVGRLERGIDLLLTDIVMPGLSGLDLAQRLRRRQPDLRVLFMSGYSDSPLLRAGLAREGSGFLQKPFSADALERRVRELLDA
jgi:two-component system cell cycle sensor histidine kinase/response regulator CckA